MSKIIPNARKFVLSNGIKIITEKIDEVRSVAVGIILSCGSGSEDENESGICHFIEHMIFKGTPRRSAFQIAAELDSIGGRINASTGKEYTNYYAVVIDEHIDLAIDVLSDIFLNSIFSPPEIELEKKVIISEIDMYEDTPDEYIHDLFNEVMLSGHPLGRNTLGSIKTVKSFNRQKINSFLAKTYHPDNIIISIAGDIDPEKTVKLIEKKFKNLKGKSAVQKPKIPKLVKKIRFVPKDTEQVHFCLGSKGVSQTEEKRYAFAVLDNILGGSISSRLFQQVREKQGLSYSIFSYNSSFKDLGLFSIYAGVKRGNFEKTVKIILKELSQIKKEGVTPAEIQRAKEYIKGNLVLGLESTYARMNYLSRSELYYNKVITIDEIFSKISKVSNQDIIQIARENFKDEFLSLIALGPFKKGEKPLKDLQC